MVKASTIRIIFTLAMTRGWEIQQVDINNAILNGDLQEEVFMNQPEGFIDPTEPTYVCKLRKALYGLKQAPRDWFDKLKGALLNWGFVNSVSDTSIFYTRKIGIMILILVYVHSKFALKTLGSVNYFLGFEVTHSPFGLHLNQSKYA